MLRVMSVMMDARDARGGVVGGAWRAEEGESSAGGTGEELADELAGELAGELADELLGEWAGEFGEEPTAEIETAERRLCPSGQPEMEGAEVFGLIDASGSETTTMYLEHRAPLTAELRALAAPLAPSQVFRFSATCQRQCIYWDERCGLVDRVVELVPSSSLTLPRCQIRDDCRWFSQQGREACGRCPPMVAQGGRSAAENERAGRPEDAARGRAERERSGWWQRLPGSATG